MPIPSELRTARLRLRPWRADDAARLEPILRRDTQHLGPWIPAAVATPASAPLLAERLSRFAADFAVARAWRFALIDDAMDELLGEIDLFPRNASGRVPLDDADRAEVGYWLRSDRTSRGFATEGVRAVMQAAASLGRFSHIEIRCDPRNVRSAAIPARLGFHLVVDDAQRGTSGAEHAELAVWVLPIEGTLAPDAR